MNLRALLSILTLIISQVIMAQGYDKLQELTPKSPNAAELERHALVPVNQYTGAASINIPAYNLNFNGRTIPIGFQYHSGGIRVSQEASWVGLGWSLTSQMAVTRRINQSSDIGQTKDGNSFANGYAYADPVPAIPSPTYLSSLEQQAPIQQVDTQPDIFMATLINGTVKFQLSNKQAEGSIYGIILNDSKAIVDFDEVNNGFVITDDQGYVYEFYAKEYTSNFQYSESATPTNHYVSFTNGGNFAWSDTRDVDIVTAWFLTKITSPDGHILEYKYYGEETFTDATVSNDTYYLSLSPTVVNESRWLLICDENGNSYPGSTSSLPVYYFMRSIQENKYLKEILYRNTGERIVFKIGDRQDIKGYNNELPGVGYNVRESPKRLDQIEVFASNGKSIKKVKLEQDYFNVQDLNEPDSDNSLRLKLDGVFIDNKLYSFTYDRPNLLPLKTSPGIDFWGFYNGRDAFNNDVRYPTQKVTNNYLLGRFCDMTDVLSTGILPGGNLGSNFNYGEIGTLKSITYPSGGSTHFEYESHTVAVEDNPDQSHLLGQTAMNLSMNINDTDQNPISTGVPNVVTYKVGGLRIKRIENKDLNGNTLLVKEYKYHGLDPTKIGMSSGKLMSGLMYYYPVESYYDPGGINVPDQTNIIISSGNRVHANNSAMGNHVGYTFVEEKVIDATDESKNLGRIVTEYINEPNEQINSTKYGFPSFDAPSIVYEEGNGQVRRQEFFKGTSTDPIKIVDNLYDDYVFGRENGLKVYYSDVKGWFAYGGSLAYSVAYDWFLYTTKRTYSLLKEMKVTERMEDGTLHEIQTNYVHNSEKPLLKSKEVLNSRNDEVRTEYFYPFESTLYGIGSESYVNQLVSENRISEPLYTRNYYNNQLINHQITKYNSNNGINGFNGVIKPEKIAFQTQEAPLSSIEDRVEILSYDEFGNVQRYKKSDGLITELVWGFEGAYPIAKIDNSPASGTPVNSIVSRELVYNAKASEATIHAEIQKIRNHPDYQQSLITSYYHKPGIGVGSINDVREYKTSYDYDGQDRLKEVRDASNFLLEDYNYNLSFETSDCLENCDGDLTLTANDYGIANNQAITITHSMNGSFSTTKWEIHYGDGTVAFGTGNVPNTFQHTYQGENGLMPIRLFLYNNVGQMITGSTNVRVMY